MVQNAFSEGLDASKWGGGGGGGGGGGLHHPPDTSAD